MYKKNKLKNGIRVIKVPNKNTQTITILILFNAGSREENPKNEGIAHFLEHMFFKGTEKRPSALDISKELDHYGASSNAFTGKEYTGFWVKISKENYKVAIDVISDILKNPKFEQTEMDKERGAIIEEINMYEDTPMDSIDIILENMLYKNTKLGHDQLGKKENINKYNRKDLLDFYNQYYNTKNMVITISGNFSEKRIESELEKCFSDFRKGEKTNREKITDNQKSTSIVIKNKKTDQTNLSIAFRTFGIDHKNLYALDLLNIILGGNTSSRLYESVREKEGLAYYIYSYNRIYKDVGHFAIQSGVGNDKYNRAIEIILNEISKIKEAGITEEELKRAKQYIKGKISISLESSDSIANFFAMQEITKGKILTPQERFDKINQVKINDINRLAKQIFKKENLNLAVIGPIKDSDKEIKKLLNI